MHAAGSSSQTKNPHEARERMLCTLFGRPAKQTEP
jgi:hypothetical protein